MFRKMVTALLVAVSFSITHPVHKPTFEEETMLENPEPSVPPKRKMSARKLANMKFEASRSRKTQLKIVKKYAEWYAINKLGYTPEQFAKVDWIWEQESHWNWDAEGAQTSDGTAKGIPQVKWSAPIKSPFRQVEKGFEYINHRYGGPDEAYAFKKKNGVY